MIFKQVKLGDIFDIARGGSPRPIDEYITDDADGLNWISIKDASNSSKYIFKTEKKIKKEGLSKSRYVEPDDFLLTNSMSFGRPYIMKTSGCIHDGWLVLKADKSKVDIDFFYHLLSSDFIYRKFTGLAAGAVVKNLNTELVRSVEVPLPSLEEQRRIASILDKADDIRQKRQQAIAKLDEFLQATFIDMFGDPLENSKNFPIKKLSEFYIDPKNGTKCGPFGSALKREEYTDSGIPVWSMDVLSLKGEFHDQPSLWISDEKYSELETYAVIEGDILISRAGTVGKMGVVRSRFEKSIISTNLIRLRFGNKLLSDYFVSLMTFCKTRLPRLKTGADGAFTHMNTGILDNLEFPYPPIEIQNEYLKIYTHIHKQKEALLKSASKFDYLFNALQQKAFNGTL